MRKKARFRRKQALQVQKFWGQFKKPFLYLFLLRHGWNNNSSCWRTQSFDKGEKITDFFFI